MTPAPTRRPPSVPALLAVILAASLLVHVRTLIAPTLREDDFAIVRQSWTWQRVSASLWEPMNEHCWPAFRLAVYAVNQCSGGLAGVPLAAMLFTRLTLLAATLGLFLFVKRERGPFAGLVAAAVFGVTGVYAEAVFWFAASPALVCLATAAVALLGAQRWLAHRQWVGLATATAAAAFAPAWFGGGVLVGPLVGLYLFGRRPGRWWAWAVPVAATAAYFAACVPLAGERMARPPHHGGRTAVQAFDAAAAAENTGRAITDQIVLGVVSAHGVSCPLWLAAPLTAATAVAAVWWWRRAGRPRAVLVGFGFVLLNYLLAYGLRSAWPYPEVVVSWSRYNVFPQFGVALVIGCGLPAAGVVTPRQRKWLLVAVAVLLVIHAPRGWLGSPEADPTLTTELRRVSEADANCREHRIAADDASAVMLGPTPGYPRDCIWRCLWGSPNPEPRPPDEIRRLLAE